ncbi:MAG: hypothetical protein AAGF11_13685 [Myxococcota bacterium]
MTGDPTGDPTGAGDEDPTGANDEDPTGADDEDPTGADEDTDGDGDDVPEVDPPPESATVIATVAGPLAVDEAWVYVGPSGASVPSRVPKSGGEPESLGTLAGPSVALLTVDEDFVYWSAGSVDMFAVRRVPKAGGSIELVTDENGPNLAAAQAIALDDTYVYLTMPDIFNSSFEQQQGSIRRIPKAGGSVEELSSDYSRVLAVGSGSVYWARERSDGGADLVRSDPDGGNTGVVLSEFGLITDVSIAADRMYWVVDDAGQQQVRSALVGEDPSTLVVQEISEMSYITDAAVTETSFLWLQPGGANSGAVFQLDLDGSTTQLAMAPASSTLQTFGGPYGRRIVVDDDAAYWSYEGAQGGSERIYRIAR